MDFDHDDIAFHDEFDVEETMTRLIKKEPPTKVDKWACCVLEDAKYFAHIRKWYMHSRLREEREEREEKEIEFVMKLIFIMRK